MAVVRRRDGRRKSGHVGLGRRFISFKTLNNDRHFSVHEDLLCRNAKFFKSRIQSNRKKVDGICSLCHDVLDPKTDDVTFCRSGCGQNIHEKCIEEWMQARNGPTTCPMCRKFWKLNPEELVSVDQHLDQDAVQAYVDWLYTGRVYDYDDINQNETEFPFMLLKAWKVSDALGDHGFRKAIIANYFRSTTLDRHHSFSAACIEAGYKMPRNNFFYTFMVEVFLEIYHVDDIASQLDKYPPKFTQELCIAALRARAKENPKSKHFSKNSSDEGCLLESSDDEEVEELEVEDEN